jgi:hypothetical protein
MADSLPRIRLTRAYWEALPIEYRRSSGGRELLVMCELDPETRRPDRARPYLLEVEFVPEGEGPKLLAAVLDAMIAGR